MKEPWPKGVVSKGTRKVPDAVSYRAKIQRQPICPARSSPADGEKNLHRRIFLFQVGTAILNSHAVVFISPNLAELGCRREYRHDKNTAYSGSLDARRNNQQQIGLTIIRTICCLYNLLSWLSIVKTIYRQNNLSIKLSIDTSTSRFVELSNYR